MIEPPLAPMQLPGATRPTEDKKVVLADGSPLLCELAKYHLENEGYVVDVVMTADALADVDLSGYKALILDCNLPGLDVYDFVESRMLDGDTCDVAVLMMCVPTSESCAYETLDAGADAVIRKPFSMRELSARLKAILRRHQPVTPRAKVIRHVSHDRLSVDLETFEVVYNDMVIYMPRRLAELLGYLMSHPNHFYRADELGRLLWPDHLECHNEIYLESMVEQIKHYIGRYSLYLLGGPRFGYCYVEKESTACTL